MQKLGTNGTQLLSESSDYPDKEDFETETDEPKKKKKEDEKKGSYPSVVPVSPSEGLDIQAEAAESIFGEEILDLTEYELLNMFESDEQLSELLDSLTQEDINELLESENIDENIVGLAATIRVARDVEILESVENLSDEELYSILSEEPADRDPGDEHPEDEDEFTEDDLIDALKDLSDEELDSILAEVEKEKEEEEKEEEKEE
jgi:hypothetical protein